MTRRGEKEGGERKSSVESILHRNGRVSAALPPFPHEEDEGDVGEEGEDAEVTGEEGYVREPERLREKSISAAQPLVGKGEETNLRPEAEHAQDGSSRDFDVDAVWQGQK
jgi:hypothetical protein